MDRESRVIPVLSAWLLTIAVTLGTSACISLQATAAQAGHRTYLGLVRIHFEPGPDPAVLRNLDAEVLGLRVERGFALGYARDRSVEIPADCRMVFIVKDVEDFRSALRLLDNHAEESQRCVIQNWH